MILALNVTFVGLAVVLLTLILLAFIIYLFSKVLNAGKKNNKMYRSDADESSLKVDTGIKTGSTLHIRSDDDSELVAVLTAAVIAAMGGGLESSIRVKSYRRIPQSSPVWNVVSRKEQLAAKL